MPFGKLSIAPLAFIMDVHMFCNPNQIRPFFEACRLRKLISASALVTTLLSSCSFTEQKVDSVKNPKSVVGKCFNLDAGHPVFASSNPTDAWNFEENIREQVEKDAQQRIEKKGKLGGALDTIANFKSIQKSVLKSMDLHNLPVHDLNVDASKHRSSDSLSIVVLSCAKIDTRTPILKVRVINKAYAGSEVWITASTLHNHGHEINFGKTSNN